MSDAAPPPLFEVWYATVAVELTGRIVAAVGDPVVGREAAAEALARAYERWPRVGAMESPEGWVHRTAVNLCRRSWRRRQLERRALVKLGAGRPELIHDPTADPALDAGDVLVAGHRTDELGPLLSGLPPRMRQAVELRYWHNLSEAEVARWMGVTSGTASALLSQARHRLARALTAAAPPPPNPAPTPVPTSPSPPTGTAGERRAAEPCEQTTPNRSEDPWPTE